MSVTVVMCAYERRKNLRLALQALARQTTDAFGVVVAEEGPGDGTRELVERLAARDPWKGRLHWVGTGPTPTGGSRPRNVGIANAAADTSLLVMLDTDILLDAHGIARFAEVHAAHPGAAIFGTVHWLAPMALDQIERTLQAGGVAALRDHVPTGNPTRVEGTIVGPEARPTDRFAPAHEAAPSVLEPELALSTAAFSLDTWRAVEGYDEEVRGYGYEDMAFGIRLHRNETPAVLVSDIIGLHVWHPKSDWSARAIEGERNLDYILRRYGADATSDAWADWSVWWHYHAERGGTVIRADDTLWAVDRHRRSRLELPSTEWVTRLGCDALTVPVASERELALIRIAGLAHELPLRRTPLSV